MFWAMKRSQVLDKLRRACKAAGGQYKFAAAIGVSAAHVSNVINEKRPPSPKILAALGLTRAKTEDYRVDRAEAV